MQSPGRQFPPAAPAALLRDPGRGEWRLLSNPAIVLAAHTPGEVLPLLERVTEEGERSGFSAAGYVTYEAAPAFDPAFVVRPSSDAPLAWFALFRTERTVMLPPARAGEAGAQRWEPGIGEQEYRRAIGVIKERIREGDTYQVNFTFPLVAPPPEDAWQLFLRLVAAQPECYGAWIDTGDRTILSASPELFFRLEGGVLESKPMKGTATRAPVPAEDEDVAARLAMSEKDRAENLMIVDMVRNDLGRIAESGSVSVPKLFDVERHPTIWQMTSTVRCRTEAGVPEVFRALFPPASITGAPKGSTMRIIAGLETVHRGVYTGAVGRIDPGERALFNVAIRTVEVDRRIGTARYGVGSGVTWQSDEEAEYRECLAKARVLSADPPDFALVETLLWTPGEGYPLLSHHLQRMGTSAAYFGRVFDADGIAQVLERAASGFGPGPQRVRLLLAADGAAGIEAVPLAPLPSPYRVRLASSPVRSEELWLHHKTTRRGAYDRAMQTAEDADDVVLWNERGELTETCIANVALRIDGRLCTPPARCGLLPGVRRGVMIARGELEERVLLVSDLEQYPEILCLNAVRGIWPAVLQAGGPR
jgi:para-aminobenzoate synthetase/4-amino-4-deoxychorismate lyase